MNTENKKSLTIQIDSNDIIEFDIDSSDILLKYEGAPASSMNNLKHIDVATHCDVSQYVNCTSVQCSTSAVSVQCSNCTTTDCQQCSISRCTESQCGTTLCSKQNCNVINCTYQSYP